MLLLDAFSALIVLDVQKAMDDPRWNARARIS
jgi:hypothetical protein